MFYPTEPTTVRNRTGSMWSSRWVYACGEKVRSWPIEIPPGSRQETVFQLQHFRVSWHSPGPDNAVRGSRQDAARLRVRKGDHTGGGIVAAGTPGQIWEGDS